MPILNEVRVREHDQEKRLGKKAQELNIELDQSQLQV